METSPFPSARIVCIFAVLAAFATAARSQVVEEYEINDPTYVRHLGPRPYDFSPLERKGLIAIAGRSVSPGAKPFDISAYYVCSETSIRCREVPRADMLFGPYDHNNDTFVMDAITCIRNEPQKNAWGCKTKESWTYLRSEGINSIVAFKAGVSLEAARLIAAYQEGNSYCRSPKEPEERRSDRETILAAHHISLDDATGDYRLGEGCWLMLRVKDATVELIDQGREEILY
jgi:hypothetical protein